MTHQVAKINNVVQTTSEEITGKTAKTLLWDRNGPKREIDYDDEYYL
jgi:hypothetical protein